MNNSDESLKDLNKTITQLTKSMLADFNDTIKEWNKKEKSEYNTGVIDGLKMTVQYIKDLKQETDNMCKYYSTKKD
jgi:hypothetical protein